MERHSFLKGAFILVFASMLVRTLGFIYQVMMVRFIGTEGIGIFNMVYPLYITALVLLTAGLPLAVSKYVAEEMACSGQREAEKILVTATTLLLTLASVGTLFVIIVSPSLIRTFYADQRVIPAFLIMVPSLLLVAVSSAIRGFFQGLQNMRPTALTQLIEQVIRCVSGLTLVYFLYPYGLTWATVGLSLAILLSEAGGLIYLWRLYRVTSISATLIARPTWSLLPKLFAFGIPVTITRIALTLMNALEAGLIPRQLMKAGFSLSAATSFYGELTGVAFTLLMIPSTLSFSLSTSLVPAISEAMNSKQKKLLGQRTTDAVGITLLAGVPCALLLYYWGADMALLLFKAHQAGYLLKILALGSIFLYTAQTTSGILQGAGLVKIIFCNTALSGLVRLAGIYCLGHDPLWAITAIAASYAASHIVLALLNLSTIKWYTGFRLPWLLFVRLLAAGFLLSRFLVFLHPLIAGSVFNLVVLSVMAVFSFFALLFLTGDPYTRLLGKHLLRAVKRN